MTTPNARVILPAEATEEMMLAGMASAERMATATQGDAIIDGYSSMVATSPNSGRVTAEMLEAAARAAYRSHIDDPSRPLRSADRARLREIWTDEIRKYWMTRVRAAFEAIGLTVEG